MQLNKPFTYLVLAFFLVQLTYALFVKRPKEEAAAWQALRLQLVEACANSERDNSKAVQDLAWRVSLYGSSEAEVRENLIINEIKEELGMSDAAINYLTLDEKTAWVQRWDNRPLIDESFSQTIGGPSASELTKMLEETRAARIKLREQIVTEFLKAEQAVYDTQIAANEWNSQSFEWRKAYCENLPRGKLLVFEKRLDNSKRRVAAEINRLRREAEEQ